jgi:hypothetical protein
MKNGSNFKNFLDTTKIFERFAQIAPINQNNQSDILLWIEELISLSNEPLETRIKKREDGRMEMKSSFRYDIQNYIVFGVRYTKLYRASAMIEYCQGRFRTS